MLDADTKRRIDTARDILVGKVPDPKSQVEQITIALIYKFMDDMDALSEELGGERSFFAGEFGRYGWAKLMQPGLGGHEMLGLYAEAIERMDQNAGIPQLFRDIFSNAFLPYRDPETLRVFLKEIDGFTYDNSERLGDAFEYLLSVMDSQGDAGQFRTPRHIIDFMVSIVDPKKEDVVLDPACGTAGFLISSYKHILAANTDADENSTLTPDDRKRLAKNLMGYDISPDMVRLSLVNMYLHGLVDPHIYEYDTLTSEERWNEFADVILANPPFMSPKGGIRPHKRFSVESKRSEVLFVDYMAEHLNAGGRAGIIVPEGIIFQSQNAHKQLRKKLVEECLVAVVSLPGGVFNPYSGVKTSILLLDKALARKTDRIAFYKVENDGFDLGAQRRPIERNDLPQVRDGIAAYMWRLREGEAGGNEQPEQVAMAAESRGEYVTEGRQPRYGIIVEKKKVNADGEYNLSGERYRQQDRAVHSKWETVAIGDICSLMTGGTPKSTVADYYEDGTVPWLVSGDIHKMEIRECEGRITEKGVANSNAKYLPVNSVLIALNGQGKTRGTVAMLRIEEATCNQSLVSIAPLDEATACPEFIFWTLRSMYAEIRALTGNNERSGLNKTILRRLQIPLPPLEVQKEIVAEIEGYQKVIDGARAVVENYRPHVPVDPDWPMAKVEDVCVINPKKTEVTAVNGATFVSFVPMSDMGENTMHFEPKDCRELKHVGTSYTYFRENDVLIAKVTPCFENGKAGIAKGLRNGIGFGSSEFFVLRSFGDVLPTWIFLYVATPAFRKWAVPQMTGTGGLQRVPKSVLKGYRIPVPDLNTQEEIVTELEAEQAAVDANRELIKSFEKKIQNVTARIWN